MNKQLKNTVDMLRHDGRSSASEILLQVLSVLREARKLGETELTVVGRELCLAQPCMASVWNAVAIALGSPGAKETFSVFEQRVLRAPPILARFTAETLLTGFGERDQGSLRVVTCSSSGSVLRCLKDIALQRQVRVACAEGRPLLEGRKMAKALTEAGLVVDLFTDAAVGLALEGSAAVIVGADAVASHWMINKCGTRQLAAAANSLGIPVHVVASRDKFVAPELEGLLVLRDGPIEEVWDSAPTAVSVWNPYFEKISIDLVTSIISDIGVISPGMMPDVCEAVSHEVDTSRLTALLV